LRCTQCTISQALVYNNTLNTQKQKQNKRVDLTFSVITQTKIELMQYVLWECKLGIHNQY